MSDTAKQQCTTCIADGICFVRACTQATHLVAPNVTNLMTSVLEGKLARGLFIDLSETDYMDSTFMGSLVLMQQQAEGVEDFVFGLLNPTTKAMGHLEVTGIHEIITIQNDTSLPDADAFSSLTPATITSLQKEELMLGAHESLSELNDKNAAQFALLNKTLREDIERKKGKSS